MTIGRFRRILWEKFSKVLRLYYRYVYKMDLGVGVIISPHARLDKGVGYRIHIGDDTQILAYSTVLGHDFCRKLSVDTYIGDNCIVGINSIILPGLIVGNQVVIGNGAVVTKNIPSHCMVVGNPARIIRTDVKVSKGTIIDKGVSTQS